MGIYTADSTSSVVSKHIGTPGRGFLFLALANDYTRNRNLTILRLPIPPGAQYRASGLGGQGFLRGRPPEASSIVLASPRRAFPFGQSTLET